VPFAALAVGTVGAATEKVMLLSPPFVLGAMPRRCDCGGGTPAMKLHVLIDAFSCSLTALIGG